MTSAITPISQHSTGPSVYLRGLDMSKAQPRSARALRRADLQRIFGVLPSCHSLEFMGSVSNAALRRMGIPVYLTGVAGGAQQQPFWYGGLLTFSTWAGIPCERRWMAPGDGESTKA